MITEKQFLPLLSSFTQEGREKYVERLKKWNETDMPKLAAISNDEWSDEDTVLFDEGLILLTTIMQPRAFVKNAYNVPPQNRIKYFCGHMQTLISRLRNSGWIEADKKEQTNSHVYGRMSERSIKALQMNINVLQGKAGRGRPIKEDVPELPAAGVDEMQMHAPGEPDPLRPDILDRRPQHFVEYADKLPADLQAQGANIGDEYIIFADLANQLENLCNDPKSFKGDRALVAQKLCNQEEKIALFWKRVDAAYAEATGKTVSTDYKQYLDKEAIRVSGELRTRSLGEYTRFEIEQMPDGAAKDEAKAARIDRNKKLLRRSDRKRDTNEQKEYYAKVLEEAATELHDWDILITDTQCEVCALYGYQVPTDWAEPSKEERERLRKEERNRKDREKRAAARAERKAQKEAAEADRLAPYIQEGASIY